MSISIFNYTEFPNLRFTNLDRTGNEFGVFMVKSTWDVPFDGGRCTASAEQEPFRFTDLLHGELNESSIASPSDFVPYRPKSDISLNAIAYAPNGEPSKSWTVGVRLIDESNSLHQELGLRIYGPRKWVPKWSRALTDSEKRNWRKHKDLFIGWELSDPEPISFLPIRYEYAFGGAFELKAGGFENKSWDVSQFNPIGVGRIHQTGTDHTLSHPAHQIEFLDDPITNPLKDQQAAGFGPIAQAWLPRRSFGGTYDKAWLDNTHPNWPQDYDFEYHNASNPKLRATAFLGERIKFELVGLHPEKRNWIIEFNAPTVAATFESDESSSFVRLNADSFHFDLNFESHRDPRLFVNLRAAFDAHSINLIELSELLGSEFHADTDQGESPKPLAAPYPEQVAVPPHKLDPDYEEDA